MVDLNLTSNNFPDPEKYDPIGGLIAYGGDLSVERLLEAYQLGIFPWYNPDEEILWWCPDPRFVLFPQEVKVSKSMRKILKGGVFTYSMNSAFKEVMENCMSIPRTGQDGTWISTELIDSFTELHKRGIAKSVEVWQDEVLVGGFYGLLIGNVFCGESMFSKVSNASKAGFIQFILNNHDKLSLIDCQVYSSHLESLGARMISKREFLQFLTGKVSP